MITERNTKYQNCIGGPRIQSKLNVDGEGSRIASADLTAARHPGLTSWDSIGASTGQQKINVNPSGATSDGQVNDSVTPRQFGGLGP